ncbi:ankyrin repeat domain-containing protein [Candidatus Babeliales bacterium]|nr:ankyrin repeat domain-containing protein [Candidatus Babeliales bacterium]
MKHLLEAGANPNQRGDDSSIFYGYTPLHIAVLESNIDIIKILLEYHAFPLVENNDQETALGYVRQRLKGDFHRQKDQDILNMLEEHLAKYDYKKKKMLTNLLNSDYSTD